MPVHSITRAAVFASIPADLHQNVMFFAQGRSAMPAIWEKRMILLRNSMDLAGRVLYNEARSGAPAAGEGLP
jgi:hypothetical protein